MIPSNFSFRASGIAWKLLPPSFYRVLSTSSSNVNIVKCQQIHRFTMQFTERCNVQPARHAVSLCNHLWKTFAL